MASCDLLSNYLRVLLRIGQDPNLRIRDLAAMLGLTERAIQHIVEHLEADGYLSHSHIGRRNTYTIYREMLIDELGLSVGELLDLVARQRSTPAWKTVLVQPVSPRRSLPKAQR